MSVFEDEFLFEIDPDDDDEQGFPNIPQEMIPLDEPEKPKTKPKNKRPVNISHETRRDPSPSMLSRQKLESLYRRVSPLMSQEQKKYTEKVIKGQISVDPHYEMELLVRQFSILLQEVFPVFIDEKRVSRDFAATTDSFRQALKDLNDFNRLKAEDEQKDSAADVINVSDQQKARDRMRAILGGDR